MSSDFFGDFQQQQMSRQDNRGDKGGDIKEVARAASSLEQTGMLGLRQQQMMNSMVQQQQMQIQQLTMTVQQLLSQLRTSAAMSMSAAPPPPVHYTPNEARLHNIGHGAFNMISGGVMGGASFAYGAMRDAAYSGAKGLYGSARGFYRDVVSPWSPTPTGFGGEVSAGMRQGAMSTALNGMGSFYNPAMMRNATFGAYQRGVANNLGQRAQDTVMGGFSALAGLGSASTIGGFIGGRLIPVPLVGDMIGSTLAAPLDAINPISYFGDQIKRATYLGDMSQHASHGFLRGRNSFQLGKFNMREEGDIGLQVRKHLTNDMTLMNEDISAIMKGGAESGQFLGVQNAQQYVDRLKKKLDTAKMVMKLANVASSEASDMMAEAFGTMGFKHGAAQNRFFAQASALAPLAGMDMRQMIGVAAQGAQSYASAGMLSTTGARQGMQTRALAGMGATFGVGTDTLASVGGEEGLARVIAGATQKYLQGVGGQMIGLGGGGYGSFGQGIASATRGIQSSGDMVGYLANSNKRIDRATEGMGGMGVQLQQARDLLQLADEYKGIGGSTQDRMKLLARSMYGMNENEADALVSSFKSLGQGMKQQRGVATRNFQDLLRDQAQENYGFGARVRMGFRRAGETLMGGAIEGAVHMADNVGEKVQYGVQRAFDAYSGVSRRYVNEDTVRQIGATKSLANLDYGGASGDGNMSVGKMSDRLNYVRGNSPTGKAIDGLVRAANQNGGKNAAKAMAAASWALRTGKQFESAQDLYDAYQDEMGGRDMTDKDRADALNMGALAGVSSDTLESMSKSMGMQGQTPAAQRAKSAIVEDLRKAFGLDMASDEEVIGGAANETVKAIVQGVKELFALYDPRKEDDQGSDFEAKSKALANMIANITDPASKKLVDSMLREAGVTITSSGHVSFEGAMSKLGDQSGIKMQRSKFGRSPGEYAVMGALKDLASGKSIEEIAKTNKHGADYLRNVEGRKNLKGLNVGVLSAKNAGALIDEASSSALRENQVKAVRTGLSLFGEKGSELRGVASAALGGVNTETGSLNEELIGQRFAGISDDELKKIAKGDDKLARKIAGIVGDMKSGRIKAKEAGDKIAVLAMQAGNMGGEVMEGRGVDAALNEGLVGSEAAKQMLSYMDSNTAAMTMIVKRLENL